MDKKETVKDVITDMRMEIETLREDSAKTSAEASTDMFIANAVEVFANRLTSSIQRMTVDE